MAKKELTVSEFREIIREEAMKLKKRMVLENEKRALEEELKSLNESMYEESTQEECMDENMEEAWWKRAMGDEDTFMQDLKIKARSLHSLTGNKLSDDRKNMLIAQAKADSFSGALQVTKKGPEGELVYIPGKDAKAGGPGVTSIAR